MTAEGIFKSIDGGDNKSEGDTKERILIGRGAGDNIKVFWQDTAPEPGDIIPGILNLWYDTDDGHLYYFNEIEGTFIDLAGWA